MKLITERTQIREVAALWRKQYPQPRRTIDIAGDKIHNEIAGKLDALDVEAATAADVAAIIGNTSWCHQSRCDECNRFFPAAIQVGEEPDYESSTAILCLECLEKALALVRQA